jgi:hypothetical protein
MCAVTVGVWNRPAPAQSPWLDAARARGPLGDRGRLLLGDTTMVACPWLRDGTGAPRGSPWLLAGGPLPA